MMNTPKETSWVDAEHYDKIIREAENIKREGEELKRMADFLMNSKNTLPTSVEVVCFSKVLKRSVSTFEVLALKDDLLQEVHGEREAPLPGRLQAYKDILNLKGYFSRYYKKHDELRRPLNALERRQLFVGMWKKIVQEAPEALTPDQMRTLGEMICIENPTGAFVEELIEMHRKDVLRIVKELVGMRFIR